jgi:hypothetical protein
MTFRALRPFFTVLRFLKALIRAKSLCTTEHPAKLNRREMSRVMGLSLTRTGPAATRSASRMAGSKVNESWTMLKTVRGKLG